VKSEKVKAVIGIIIIVFLFILISYLVQSNIEFFESYFDFGIWGMGLFLIIVILSIVITPLSSVPLFPLASGLWGWPIAAVIGIIGWTIGAVTAFTLARRYGIALVEKIIPVSRIHQFEKKFPQEHVFWTVVFLRMIIPVDGLSYFLGLFSKISTRAYILATLIGVIPFSFAIAYLGSMTTTYQIVFSLTALVILIIGLTTAYHREKGREVRKKRKEAKRNRKNRKKKENK